MSEVVQHSSAAVAATDRYSASVDDLATPVCFFEDHATG